MLENLFGLVKKSRLDAALDTLAEAKKAASQEVARVESLVRGNHCLSSELADQKKLVVSLRQSLMAGDQEYQRVCAKLVELSDTVRELTEKLNHLQETTEMVGPCAEVTRKRFRGRPTSRMTATDFVERFVSDMRIRPEQLGHAASRLARARGIALSRITAKGADGVERAMNIYPTHLLREASGVQ